MHLNINRLRNKLLSLEAYIECELDIKPNVIAITETWLEPNEFKSINLPGYSIVAETARSESRGGGALLFVKNNLMQQCTPINVTTYNIEKCCELCGVCINSDKANMYIFVIYRCPQSSVSVFLENLDRFLSQLNKENVLLCGDFNINISDSKLQIAKDLLQTLLVHNLKPTVMEPTRSTKSTKTTIDNIFTDNHHQYLNAYVAPCSFSDHDAQIIHLKNKLTNHNIRHKIVKNRCYTRAANTRFRTALEKIDWWQLLSNLSPSEQLTVFYNTMHELIDKYYPIKTCRIPLYKKKWLSKGIRQSCRTKRKMYINLKRSYDETLDSYLKLYQHVLKKVLITAKQLHAVNTIKKARNKSKAVWNLVKENTGKLTIHKGVSWKIEHGTEIISDPRIVANLFNQYFLSVGENSNNTCKTDNFKELLKKKKVNNVKSMFIKPLVEPEIIKIAKSLKNSNSCGPDELHTCIIKNNIDILCIPICHIFNEHINLGVFPEALKRAKVIPVYKKGGTTKINNYRPISLLSVLTKILEKCLAERLQSHMNVNGYISTKQFGFLKGKNTTTAITGLTTQILNNLNDGLKCAGIFCDLSKAFDCVDHDILLYKLEYYGLRGSVLNLFSSYLSNRRQFVEIKCSDHTQCEQMYKSAEGTLRRGVPQGSVLGPLLFIIFINDLPDNVFNGTPYLYADDTSLILGAECYERLTLVTNRGWGDLSHWFSANGLSLNKDKCFYMIFKRALNSVDCVLNLPLTKTDSIRFLGVELDPCIKWYDHVNYVVKRLGSACYTLKSMAKVGDKKTLRTIYYSYVESIIRYGIEVWGNSSYVNKILIMQKKCLRFIEGYFPETHRHLFTKNSIYTVTALYIYQIGLHVFKNQNLYELRKVCERYPLRRDLDLVLPHSHFAHFKKSFNYIAIKIYNHLEIDIKNSSNINEFSGKLKSYLIRRPFYNLDEYFGKIFD
jgi:hypothetical protein